MALKCSLPLYLRPVTPKDIVEGKIIWYPKGHFWKIVEEVRYPDDDFKAYLSEGSLYGLEGGFVELNLRPATANDVTEGEMFWYPNTKDPNDTYSCVIDTVLRPHDPHKAYMSGGARYGLDGAFVEVK